MNIESDDDVSSFNIFYSPLQAIQSMDSDCEAAYRTTSDKKEYKSRRLLSTDSAGCSSSQRLYKSKRIIQNIPGVTAAPQITCNCVLLDGSPVRSATQHFAHDSPYAQIGDHNTENYAHGDSTSTATCIDHYKSRRLVFLEPDPCSHLHLTNKSSSSADYKGKTKCLVSTEHVDFSAHRTVCSSYKRKTKCFVSTEEQNVPHVPLKLQAPTFCSKCGAKKFAFESLMFCCGGGEIKIADNEYPPLLIDLFTSRSELAVHFRKYSRLYNNMFAFSSLGGSIHASTKKGIYVFKLHGQLYHFVPDLIPTDNKPKFLQLYFYDAQHEKENRFGLFPELRAEIVSMLMEILANNPYAKFFKSLQHINIEENTSIVINKTTALDQRVYNAPSADEVAAILIDGFSSDETRTPYIVVWGKSNTSHRIFHYYGCYDPLQYPILFSKGECGWHQGLRKMCSGRISYREHSIYPVPPEFAHSADDLLMDEAVVAQDGSKKRKFRVSCREYYAYRLQIRRANYLLRTSRLFQHFIVDEYVKIENTRLDYMRNNQAQLRAELYQGIMDTMNSGEFNCRNVGHRIILPPSFIGGPRDMKKRYLNAMALVQKYGKPDIFLTITCNPNWLEIKEELAEGEIPQDRPDLVSRIFRAKLVVLKKHLKDKKFFGEIAAMIHVIEFQKRGLPHAHFLIILQPSCKVRQPEQFDQFVSAELPPVCNLYLRSLVLRHMIHGPCGTLDPKCPCMILRNGKRICKHNYPRGFSEFTTHSDDGYPVYRRRNTGETVRVRGVHLDNRWVIPHNPTLLALFDCHMNVEICSTIKAVKYLYKYVYKGHDKISFNIRSGGAAEVIDEIQSYQSGRWISSCEAAWRIFAFDLYDMQPPVMPLQVHLPNMQSILFNASEDLLNVTLNERRSKTALTEFFAYNATHPLEPKYSFPEFVEHYVWDTQNKMWTKRKRSKLIGRLSFVAPTEGERYYLRLLLGSVAGPCSFSDLLTVGQYTCATFHESALKRGLVEPDNLIDKCLDEAVAIQMPHALRRLFATILVFLEPCNPASLWEKYYTHLSEDHVRKFSHEPQKVLRLTWTAVEGYLKNMGKSLKDYGLQYVCVAHENEMQESRDVIDALNAPIPETCNTARKLLNSEQRRAYKCIVSCVKKNKPGLFFIDGPGGTGKTFLYCALYAKVRLLNKIVLPTATSGIAASNMPTGRTAHSRFKIPTDYVESITCNVGKHTSLAAVIRETALIIWDEATMARRENIESLDLLLRDLCLPEIPFGGKVVVLGGDFRQTVPIVPKKTQQEILEHSLVSSKLWPLFTRFQLTENIRAQEDPNFSRFLLSLGNGELQVEESSLVTIPDQICLPVGEVSTTLDQLLHIIYPKISDPFVEDSFFEGRAILTPRNEDVDLINTKLIHMFVGCSYIYKSFDTVTDDYSNIYTTEFLNTLCPPGLSPHELVLKLNCPVILLRNIDPAGGLCNGTRLICRKFMPNLIQCEISTGFCKGELVLIPRITLRPQESSAYPFSFQRKQFPIKLCFAMTINKSQGQTLNEVGVYIREPCFSHGQLYVALSRARKASNVKVFDEHSSQDNNSSCVTNVVSYAILHKAGII